MQSYAKGWSPQSLNKLRQFKMGGNVPYTVNRLLHSLPLIFELNYLNILIF